ncbi:hypothetical protein FWC31_01285 [Candidatus Saccharibacteria bacterium]|nr:hypothetical protein [Candidatus Saccharibacteria bacterium]
MKYNQLNYSALNQKKISKRNFTKKQLKMAGIKNITLWEKIGIIAVIIAIIMLIVVLESGSDWLIAIIVTTILTPLIAYGFLYELRKINEENLKLLKFALDNNLTYFATMAAMGSGSTRTTEPIMFNIGNPRIQSNTLVFPNGATLAKYQYTVGSGKNSRTYRFYYMCVKLLRPIPHLFLDSKKNLINPNVIGYKVKELKLEGDFNKYFKLLVPPGYQTDALQILTPDVMSALIDFGESYDFELIGDELYMYRNSQFSGALCDSEENMRQFLEAVEHIVGEFNQQAKTYSDVRAGNVTSGLVAKKGAKFERRMVFFNTNVNKIFIIVIIVTVVIALMSISLAIFP